LERWTIKKFLKELSSKKPTPGGGSISALVGSLAAGLTSMAAKFSGDQKTARRAERLMRVLMELIERDAQAFAGGNLGEATEVPLQTARYSYEVLKLVEFLLENCNKNLITDLGVAAKMAESSIEGALLNVKVNLASIKDEEYKKEILKAVEKLYLTGYQTRAILSQIKARLR